MVGQANRGFGTQGHEATGQNFGSGSTSGLGSTMSGMAENVREKAGDVAQDAMNRAQDLWDNTRQGMTRAATSVSDSATEAFESVTACMSRYPFATLAVGFGLGFLVAQAFSLSRESPSRW